MSNILDGYGSQFYPDQNVLARDLNLINYSNIKSFRDYLKVITYQPGVILSDVFTDTALQVTTDGTTFTVNPGSAVDSGGRVIHVPVSPLVESGSISSDPLYYPARPNRTLLTTGVVSAGIYYVNIKYSSFYTDVRYDDGGTAYNKRVYDSYTISVDAVRSAEGITLAQVQCDASGSIIQDSTETGYLDTTTGIRYALYDDRPMFKIQDGRIGDLVTLTNQHETDLNEEIDKSVGFLYPVLGHAFYSKLSRNATISRLELFCTGASGDVTVQLYSGSTADVINNSLRLIATVSTTPNIWTVHTIDLPYYTGHVLKFIVGGVTGNITECTASLVYTRR